MNARVPLRTANPWPTSAGWQRVGVAAVVLSGFAPLDASGLALAGWELPEARKVTLATKNTSAFENLELILGPLNLDYEFMIKDGVVGIRLFPNVREKELIWVPEG